MSLDVYENLLIGQASWLITIDDGNQSDAAALAIKHLFLAHRCLSKATKQNHQCLGI